MHSVPAILGSFCLGRVRLTNPLIERLCRHYVGRAQSE